MLLDDLLEPSIVQLRELCQVVHIRNNVTQIFLEQLEVLDDGIVILAGKLPLRASD